MQTSSALQGVAGKEHCTDNDEHLAGKVVRAAALLGAGVTGLFGIAGLARADEAEHGLHSPEYPWPHNGILSSYDHASYCSQPAYISSL